MVFWVYKYVKILIDSPLKRQLKRRFWSNFPFLGTNDEDMSALSKKMSTFAQ